jgi:Ca-activated chloride channel family protein
MCLILAAVCTAVSMVYAQGTPPESAEDYFNLGSAIFIRESGERALAVVDEGLVLYPDDEKLLRLKQLIEQEQENQQNQQQQDQNPEENGDDNQQTPENEQEQEQDEQEENEQNENQDDQTPSEQQPGDPSDRQEPNPEDMTEDEANMILDSLRQLEHAQREQLTQDMIRKQMNNLPPVEKDW